MSKKMKVLAVVWAFFVVMAMIGTGIFFYDQSQPQTKEEKRAELLSFLGSQELLEIRSDGQYDKDYNLVDLACSDPSSLTGRVRVVGVECYIYTGVEKTESIVYSRTMLGYIYSQEYVVVPDFLFYAFDGYSGNWINVLKVEELTTKVFLLPNPDIEDNWKVEELGEVRINRELGLAVIERVDPIIDVSQTEYTIGEYEDLEIGNVLYLAGRTKNFVEIRPSVVTGLRSSQEGANIINFQAQRTFPEIGGLLFAVRDGKLELVGMVCALELLPQSPGSVYVFALDIQAVIEYLEVGMKFEIEREQQQQQEQEQGK